MSELIIGIDVGTSVIKAVAFGLDGRPVNTAFRESGVSHPRPTWAETNMTTVLESVLECLQELVEKDPALPRRLSAIGITAQGDGTWLIDGEGQPVRPAITWLDGRVGDQLTEFQRAGVNDRVFELTGTAINTSNQAAQLRWLKDNEPEALARAQAVLRAKDWVFFSLTGAIRTDFSDASFTYFDVRKRSYAPEILGLYGIEDFAHLIPEAVPSYKNTAYLSQAAASHSGLPAGTPVASGPIDVAAAVLGVGAIEPGEACSVLGTAGIHQLVMDRVEPEPRGVGYTICHAPDQYWIRCLPTMTGTLNVQWFVREFFSEESKQLSNAELWSSLEDRASAIKLGADGVMYLPYIDPAGERVPFVKPSARAQFMGIGVHHTRDTLLRAVYESLVLSALDCYSHLSYNAITHLKLTGGGAKSGLWPQMLADALETQVDIDQSEETGAKGAMINAGVAFGLFDSYADARTRTMQASRRIEPAHGERNTWVELLGLYREAYQNMFEIWDRFRDTFGDKPDST